MAYIGTNGVLFGKERSTITEHIGNIFKEGDLQKIRYLKKSDILLDMKRLKAKRKGCKGLLRE